MDDKSTSGNSGSIAKGFGIGVGLSLLQAGLIWLITMSGSEGLGITTAIIGLGGFGIIQWIYMGPLYSYFRNNGMTETAKGLVIEAAIVSLINVGCWVTMAAH